MNNNVFAGPVRKGYKKACRYRCQTGALRETRSALKRAANRHFRRVNRSALKNGEEELVVKAKGMVTGWDII